MGVVRKISRFRANDQGVFSQCLFFIPFVCWMAVWILTRQTSFAAFFNGVISSNDIRMPCLVVLACRELLFGRWDRTTLLGAAAFALMSYSFYLCGAYFQVIEGACFVFSARNIPFKKLAWVSFFTLAVIVVATVACSQLGVIPDHVTGPKSSRGPRHFLGFGWPNTGPAFAFFAICAYFAFRGSSIKWYEGLAAIAIAGAFYWATKCRVVLILTVVVSVLVIAAARLPIRFRGERFLRVLGCIAIPAIAFAGLALAALYDPHVSWMKHIDALLSGRLSLGHWAIRQYGFSLLGQPVDFQAMSMYDLNTGQWVERKGSHPVDSLYVKSAVQYGMVFLVVGIALTICALNSSAKEGSWGIVVMIVCIAAYGLVESVAVFLYFNPLLFLIGGVFDASRLDAAKT